MSARVIELDLETGVYTRAAFEREVAFAVHVARRADQPCSLLVVDIDDFRALRDVRGDLAADSCLEGLAQRISAESNGAGPIGRLGADTFGLLLPGWALPRSCTLADRLRGAVRDDPCVMATVSVGVASLRPAEPWGNLLDAAESACTRAKQAGRDRSVHRR
ncbi:MAG TPA: GGDEF domain-containing protein [Myxococcaceae bacterium]|nr:GGDEF domain-containing protein [Myxococcaceae bacterium]